MATQYMDISTAAIMTQGCQEKRIGSSLMIRVEPRITTCVTRLWLWQKGIGYQQQNFAVSDHFISEHRVIACPWNGLRNLVVS